MMGDWLFWDKYDTLIAITIFSLLPLTLWIAFSLYTIFKRHRN